MAQLRQQFLRQVSVTVLGAATTVVDILGPESALEPPYAEQTDHVIRARQARQNESGFVVIDGWASSALDANTVSVTVSIFRRATTGAQKGLETALFPSGATAPADPVLQRVVTSAVLGDDAALIAIYGGGLGGEDVKDVPLLHVRADEFIRISIVKATGGDLAAVLLSAKFDLGMNPNDTNRL